jgi:hypothetical protein
VKDVMHVRRYTVFFSLQDKVMQRQTSTSQA